MPIRAGPVEASEFEEQLSWHPLPIWPLLLVAFLSCTRSFLVLPLFTPIPTEAAISHWSLVHLEPSASSPNSKRQRIWDSPHIAATYNALLEQAPNDQGKARLMAVARPESGAWLIMSALPIASLGLHISNYVVRIAAGL